MICFFLQNMINFILFRLSSVFIFFNFCSLHACVCVYVPLRLGRQTGIPVYQVLKGVSYTPQTVFVGGYTVFMLSVSQSVHPYVRNVLFS